MRWGSTTLLACASTGRRPAAWTGARRLPRPPRFDTLLQLTRGERDFSLLDWGCGYGALLDHLRAGGTGCRYTGFDVSEGMIARARRRHPEEPGVAFTSAERDLLPHDFIVASGIFNVKLAVPAGEWQDYVVGVLGAMDAKARRGFAFNMLTLYSDPERRQDRLYYADPCDVFDRCKRRFSARVALLHDYPLYEFTVLVRKGRALKPILILGTGDIARLAHRYFALDARREVAGFTVDRAFRQGDRYLELPLVDFEDVATRFPPSEFDGFVALSYRNMNRLRAEKYGLSRPGGTPSPATSPAAVRGSATILPATIASSSRTTPFSPS